MSSGDFDVGDLNVLADAASPAAQRAKTGSNADSGSTVGQVRASQALVRFLVGRAGLGGGGHLGL